LLYQHLKKQISNKESSQFKVVIEVNGKQITGKMRGVPKKTYQEKISRGDLKSIAKMWEMENRTTIPMSYSPPTASTSEILQRAWAKHKILPEETMELLQELYLGVDNE